MNVGPQLARNFNNEWNFLGEYAQNQIDDFVTNPDEVIKLCKAIMPLKSSGIDSVSSRILKDAFLILNHQLTHIFNSSLRSCVFPEAWKVAKVVPLFKGGTGQMLATTDQSHCSLCRVRSLKR